MKKFLFSISAFALVAASSIALAPTTASAIPAFARQTGAACLSCHFQEIPALAPMGRAFKMGSFTDMGDEGLIEDDNLSIPATLNASMVVRMNAIHTTGGGAAGTTVYNIPADDNFLVAGRVGSNTGAFVEFAGGAGNIQLLNSWDLGGFKVGGGWAKTTFGGSSVLEVSNVFGQHSGAVGDVGQVGAINNSGFTNEFSQLGAWIGNDMGYIQFALIAPAGATTGATDVGFKLAKLVRVVATLDLGGWDTLIGFGTVTGKVGKTGTNNTAGSSPGTKDAAGAVISTATITPEMNLTFIDVQLQGEVGDMSVGIYGDWAHAKGKANGNILGAADSGNTLGATTLLAGSNSLTASQKFDAYSIRATVVPMPSVAFGAGYGYRKTTDDSGTVAAPVDEPKHQVFSISGSYSLYQNSIISINYTNDKTSGNTIATGGNSSTKTTTIDWLTMM